MITLQIFFDLLCGHALADYTLQSDAMIDRKNPRASNFPFPMDHLGPWWWTMLAHSFINGFFVQIFTGSYLCAVLEVWFHFWTDTAKCKGWINTETDQLIHIACKGAWAIYAGCYQSGLLA